MTIFINAITSIDKEVVVSTAIASIRCGGSSPQVIDLSADEFKCIPATPFPYWISQNVRQVFQSLPIFEDENNGRSTRCGLGTLDDFRFIRAVWEVELTGLTWTPYFNGGRHSPLYEDFPLVVNWARTGTELRAFVEKKVGSASRKIQGEDCYFKIGFVFPRRTKSLSPKFMPAGGIFSTGGQAGFAIKADLDAAIGLLSSDVCSYLIALSQGRTGAAAQFEVGQIARIPWPSGHWLLPEIGVLARRGWSAKRALDAGIETSRAFVGPEALMKQRAAFNRVELLNEMSEVERRINNLSYNAYGLSAVDCVALFGRAETREGDDESGDEEFDEVVTQSAEDDTPSLLSWTIGVAFGRFDWRLATGERAAPPEPDPFDPLPAKSPGMLPDDAAPFHHHAGILSDDPGHPHDLPGLMEAVLTRVQAPVPADIHRWLQRDFFLFHLQRYSKSRRKAPIYWPLATSSGSYTLWLYYPNLTSQTLYTAANDFVEPKLKQVTQQATMLRTKASARTRDDERTLETLLTLEAELIELRDTMLRIAPDYHPNHDDGVQITAAPLWPLFRHKPWQKLLKETWAKLENGDYDWAHLAMAYWPERVREKCKTDKSLAIAHDLEQLYIEPPAKPAKPRGRKKGAAA